MTRRLVSRLFVMSLALVLLLLAADSRPARAFAYAAGPTMDISSFYDDLAPYGRWVDVSGYGWCWAPAVSPGWRPYRYGSWVYTDYGWAWDSDEPWGWAVFHYGRWLDDPVDGWVWVPGTMWAPAWVAWRDDDDCIGWAPLAPGAAWNVSFGLRTGRDFRALPARDWCFVERRRFLDRDAGAHALSFDRTRALIGRTRLHADYPAREGRPFNRGVELAGVARAVGHPVPRMRIMDTRAPVRHTEAHRNGGMLGVYRPAVRPASRGEAPNTARGRIVGPGGPREMPGQRPSPDAFGGQRQLRQQAPAWRGEQPRPFDRPQQRPPRRAPGRPQPARDDRRGRDHGDEGHDRGRG